MDDATSRSTSSLAAQGAVGAWLQAARVKSLAIASIAVFTGGAVAVAEHATVGAWSARLLLAWLGSVAIQAGTNLTNVSYNYKARSRAASVFTADPIRSSAPVIEGRLTAEQVRLGAYVCFGAGIACGLTLVALCGWPILAIGIPAVVAGYSYAGPPLRLGKLGMGVPTVILFMGVLMVGGAYDVVALQLSRAALAASLPIGLLAGAIMHTNDLRDYEGDVAHGKRSLATMLGFEAATQLLRAMVLGAYLTTGLAVALGLLPWPALLVLVTLPHALQHLKLVMGEREPARIHQGWLRGVQLHSEFGLLLIVGLLIASALR